MKRKIDPTMTEAAVELGVSVATVYAWCDSGKLQRYREFGETGKYRVAASSIRAMLARRRREAAKAERKHHRTTAQGAGA